MQTPSASKLPRWRGFNLVEKFFASDNLPFVEQDFEMMAEWGFDFARLPLSYECWADSADWYTLREAPLKEIDQAVAYGQRYGIHVNINFHRAPGYCVNPPEEPLSLWSDERALEASAFHWAHFAERCKGIPNEQVSFDLVNEPAGVSEEDYVRVCARLVESIRAVDPKRLIIADGLRWGRDPVPGLAALGVGQSTRGYDPMEVSHYKADWVDGADSWPVPNWPMEINGVRWDRAALRDDRIRPWKEMESRGVGVHVGEFGCYCHTPHQVALAWLEDQLSLWKEAGWGWAMWNLRGPFGPLNSDRPDVTYAEHRGHKLDQRMLDLLQRY